MAQDAAILQGEAADGAPFFPIWLAGVAAAALAFLVYANSLAPGLTWAHHGADGGDLIAAAVIGGVPHPPGYPLYTVALRAWLGAFGWLAPASDLAWRGNLLSALFASASVFLTVLTAGALLEPRRARPLLAGLAGLLWGLTPLLWSQSILTEVYAFHALIFALLGWVMLVGSVRRLWTLAIPVALGAAHHLTLLLLLPAVIYLVWARSPSRRTLARVCGWLAVGIGLGALSYARIALVARGAAPVNWGFATDADGLWWLVSGAAYRGYVFGAPATSVIVRIASWARTLAVQYTLAGMALALWGLAWWDQQRPQLRTFSLLWLGPISIYTIGYASRDAEVNLLPVVWLMALWLAVGMERCMVWSARRWPGQWGEWGPPILFAALTLAALPGRWNRTSLRLDHAARDFVQAAAAAVEPNAIVISRGDDETFALWYGTWASGEIARRAPGVVVVNEALYQFDWYRRLQATLHPDVEGAGESVEALIEANLGRRPILRTGDMQDGGAPPGLYPLQSP